MDHAQLAALEELHRLAATTASVNEQLDTLLRLTAPGGDAEQAKDKALEALARWSKQLAKLSDNVSS
eukprot:m.148376 g.148376  ORF g.148376 m.148376 type:complete len:67 (+) comp16132_c0_seq4:106-306(+)